MSERQQLGARLREARNVKGWTQREAAERAGISKESLGGYENARERAPFERVVRMAKLYGVSLEYLACRTDDPSGLPCGQHVVDLDMVEEVMAADDMASIARLQRPAGLAFSQTFPRNPLILDDRELERMRKRLVAHIARLRKET